MIHPQSSPRSIAERIAREVWAIMHEADARFPAWHGATYDQRSDVLLMVDGVLDAIRAAGLAVVEAEDGR